MHARARARAAMERVKNAKNFFSKLQLYARGFSRSFSYTCLVEPSSWTPSGAGERDEKRIKAQNKTYLHIHRLLDTPPSRHVYVTRTNFLYERSFTKLDEGAHRALVYTECLGIIVPTLRSCNRPEESELFGKFFQHFTTFAIQLWRN